MIKIKNKLNQVDFNLYTPLVVEARKISEIFAAMEKKDSKRNSLEYLVPQPSINILFPE